ncbi:MAG: prolipoprotein diacylglyceryl transferase [Actinomycetota bacterium]
MIHTSHVVGSIPSPSNGTFDIGPLHIHAYGMMIALGVVAGVWLMGRRFEQRGIGTKDDANAIAMWGVIGGVIGARLYHVATDWSKFSNHLLDIPKIWRGGLGIPGGLLLGTFFGVWAIRRRGLPVAVALDCAAPAIPLAQSIGRWGNWWNQELFGGPTKLPWALRIDAEHMPAGYAPGTTFHPTFLYESLANLALCLALVALGRKVKLRIGHLMAAYVMGYGIIRFFVEGLRIDTAHHVGGLRWNQWVALAAVVGAGLYMVISSRREFPVEAEAVQPDVNDEADLDGDVALNAGTDDADNARD